jgi:predicted nucleic acid-binding Zn ribbon protein
MKRSEAKALNELLQDVFSAQNLDQHLHEMQLMDAWEEVVGSAVKRFTKKLYVKDKVLFVSMTSSVARQELQMRRAVLLEKLNNKIGLEVIKDIIFR